MQEYITKEEIKDVIKSKIVNDYINRTTSSIIKSKIENFDELIEKTLRELKKEDFQRDIFKFNMVLFTIEKNKRYII